MVYVPYAEIKDFVKDEAKKYFE